MSSSATPSPTAALQMLSSTTPSPTEVLSIVTSRTPSPSAPLHIPSSSTPSPTTSDLVLPTTTTSQTSPQSTRSYQMSSPYGTHPIPPYFRPVQTSQSQTKLPRRRRHSDRSAHVQYEFNLPGLQIPSPSLYKPHVVRDPPVTEHQPLGPPSPPPPRVQQQPFPSYEQPPTVHYDYKQIHERISGLTAPTGSLWFEESQLPQSLTVHDLSPSTTLQAPSQSGTSQIPQSTSRSRAQASEKLSKEEIDAVNVESLREGSASVREDTQAQEDELREEEVQAEERDKFTIKSKYK
ncbi:hypothetical protein Pcinc_036872 [Petrolisthes cinctipes]|uniref:Uncharacterized protein n=1 Tax=Petrolisthes cinctipes TaxID=88211 RepID=A0AAE1ELK0_PETCI|nr:hypothetical protein Pcinc_036872 [Petrolisthes cinctipes]